MVFKKNKWAVALLNVLWWQMSPVPHQLIAFNPYCASSKPQFMQLQGGLTICTFLPLPDCFVCHVPEVQMVSDLLSHTAVRMLTYIPRTGVTDTQELALHVSVDFRVLESTCVHDRAQVTNGRRR